MTQNTDIDFTNWDWLPGAAAEMQAYLVRMLAESSIKPHDVSARAKSIASFVRKQQHKQYADPILEVTDTVAVRVITYSNTDRTRTADLIRDRFAVKDGEDRNPGDEKSDRLRRYDCQHIVVSGESDPVSGWLVDRGDLARYFAAFGGLEIQIRTVAGHAWAEFEHARRYKGAAYGAVADQDRETIDQLFGAASDARRALDETFVAIDRMLARPTSGSEHVAHEVVIEDVCRRPSQEPLKAPSAPLASNELSRFLAERFPEDADASDAGIDFGKEIVRASGYKSIGALGAALDAVDSELVRSLMEADVPVTRVRRLDDELLALLGEDYIRMTGEIGNVRSRARQLEWRFDRLRGKTRYSMYSLDGEACPPGLLASLMPAARAVREVVKIVAEAKGIEVVLIEDTISARDDVPRGARAVGVALDGGQTVYVATNLNREVSESIIRTILDRVPELDLTVVKDGHPIVRA